MSKNPTKKPFNKNNFSKKNIQTENQFLEIHPASKSHLIKGHPWITTDRYSLKFPPLPFLELNLKDGAQTHYFSFIHDPNHSKVKARVWKRSTEKPSAKLDSHSFQQDLKVRVKEAILKRFTKVDAAFKENPINFWNRENVYFFFGESDGLPGLQGHWLGQSFILQDFTKSFWSAYYNLIIDECQIVFSEFWPNAWKEKNFLPPKYFYTQQRPGGIQEFKSKTCPAPQSHTHFIKEFDVAYKLDFKQGADPGIYTDMAAIRFSLASFFKDAQVLNLYCYTGAFSLFALEQKAKAVTSIDLSLRYMTWLEENLSHNSNLPRAHHSIVGPCLDKLKIMAKQNAQFDTIICDPPSSSSDGKTRQNNFQLGEELWPLLDLVLAKQGTLILFNNTHQITRKKFVETVKNFPSFKNYQILKEIKSLGDVESLKNFPEGDYLKGVILKKKS